jgi:hypothetical protein
MKRAWFLRFGHGQSDVVMYDNNSSSADSISAAKTVEINETRYCR